MAARTALLARRLHKWIALFVGVQALVWTLTGFYMVAIHLDFIHGDHLIREVPARPLELTALQDPLAIARSVPGATGVRFHWSLGRPTYIATGAERPVLVDARSGAQLPAPTEATIRQIAGERFNGSEDIVSVARLSEVPFEIRGRAAPLWRVQFEGWNKPTLYFSSETGELLSRRHELWRVFDLFFGLHIMDYSSREDPNNWLLRFATWSAFAMALSGAWLLFYSFPRRKRRKRPA